jgi:hypothetical protein
MGRRLTVNKNYIFGAVILDISIYLSVMIIIAALSLYIPSLAFYYENNILLVDHPLPLGWHLIMNEIPYYLWVGALAPLGVNYLFKKSFFSQEKKPLLYLYAYYILFITVVVSFYIGYLLLPFMHTACS